MVRDYNNSRRIAMTINVYRYYGTTMTQGEVISGVGKYRRFRFLHILKKAFVDDFVFDWKFVELIFALMLSAINILLLFRGSEHILITFLLLFSLCLYVSHFLLSLKLFVKKICHVDIL